MTAFEPVAFEATWPERLPPLTRLPGTPWTGSAGRRAVLRNARRPLDDRIKAVVALLLLALLLPAPALPVAPAAPLAPGAPPAAAAAPGVLPEASPEAAWRHATALAGRIGPRAVGEPGYLRAVEYVEAQLRDLGYQVRRQPFTVPRFEVREVALRVTAPEPLTLRPAVLQLSGSAPPEGVTAPLVEAGVGRPEELARAGARGKVVLVP